MFEVSVDPLKGEDQQHMVSVIFENDPNETTGSVTLKDLPAGSTVKVEEVYSGAGYELESGPTPEKRHYHRGRGGRLAGAGRVHKYGGRLHERRLRHRQ